MRLLARRRADTAFIRLAGRDPFGGAFCEVVVEDVGNRPDRDRRVRAADVALAVYVHREGALRCAHRAQKALERLAVEHRERRRRADGDEGIDGRVRRREVRRLPGDGAAGEAAIRALAPPEEAHDVLCDIAAQTILLAEKLERVRNPVAEPRPRRVEARVALCQPAEPGHQIGRVLGAAEWDTIAVEGAALVQPLVEHLAARVLRIRLLVGGVRREIVVLVDCFVVVEGCHLFYCVLAAAL